MGADAPRPSSAGRLLTNLLTLFGGEAVAKVLGMVVFGYLYRTLLDARYGDLEFAIAAVFVVNLLLEAGLGPYAAKVAAADPGRTRQLAAHIASIRSVVLVAALGGLALFAWASGKPWSAQVILLLYSLVLLPVPLALNWAFQSRDEMGVVASCSVLRQAVLAAGVLTLVRGPEDAWVVPLADAAGLGASVAVQQLVFRRRVGRFGSLRDRRGAAAVLRESFPLALSSFAMALRFFFPTLALGLWSTSDTTGHFAAGHRLVVAAHTFVWLYFFNLLPSIARHAASGRMDGYRRLMRGSTMLAGWLVVGCGFAGTVLAPLLVRGLYGAEAEPVVEPFQIMIWMLAMTFLSGHYRFTLIGFGKQSHELKSSVLGTVCSVVGCSIAGGSLTAHHAAMIFVGAEAVTFAAAYALTLLHVEKVPIGRFLARPLLAGAVAALLLVVFDLVDPVVRAVVVVAVFAVGLVALQGDALRTARSVLFPAKEPIEPREDG